MHGAEVRVLRRAAAANDRDLALISECADFAVECALRGESGVVGHDEEQGDELRAIELRASPAARSSTRVDWFTALLSSIGQRP